MEIMPEYFLYLGLGLIGIELFVGVDTGFDLVLLGISTILGGLGFWLTGSLWVGVGITTIVTFSYIFFGRKFLKAKLFHSHHKTNIDRLIDNQGLVIKKITPHYPGQVKIDGEIWRAESKKTIKEKETVIVTDVNGVTLKVEKRSQ